MSDQAGKRGGELFIVDNSDQDWKVLRYLREWADFAHTFDVATGYFEIGALLAMVGQRQKLDKLRILMGDEVSKRTRRALLEGIRAGSGLSARRASAVSPGGWASDAPARPSMRQPDP